MIRRKLGFLGALSAFVVAAGCGAGDRNQADLAAAPATSDDELSEAFDSCISANKNGATDWVTNTSTLTIDASASKTGVVIVVPNPTQVKVNGRVCKLATGAAITGVQKLLVKGRPGASDTFVLDFSAGKPTGAMLTNPAGIVIDGGEGANTSTPDTIIVKGSSTKDEFTAGIEKLTGTPVAVDVSFAAWPAQGNGTRATNVQFRNVGRLVQSRFSPNLVFGLGGGDDNFSALGTGITAVTANNTVDGIPFGVNVSGGAGNDTLIGGTGSDKLDGSGDSGDLIDYHARATPVFVDMDTTLPTVWGGNLRSPLVKMASTDRLHIDPGTGTFVDVDFDGTEITPGAIVDKINGTTGLSGVASIVGGQLRIKAPTGSAYLVIAWDPTEATKTNAVHKLGLLHGVYSTVGNDGTPGGQMDFPWTRAVTRANNTAYSLGDIIVPATPNGSWYKVTTAGTSANNNPPAALATTTTVGNTVTDGTAVLTCMGSIVDTTVHYAAWAQGAYLANAKVTLGTVPGYFEVTTAGTSNGDPTLTNRIPAAPVTNTEYPGDNDITWICTGDAAAETAWATGHAYATDDTMSLGGKAFKAKAPGGTSGATAPNATPWVPAAPVVGTAYTDGDGVGWTYRGAPPADPKIPALPVRADGTVYAAGDVVTFPAATTNAKGFWFKALTAGTSDPASSNGNGPSVSAVPQIGAKFTGDGTVDWICAGRIWAPSTVYLPGEVIWDPANSQFLTVPPTGDSAASAPASYSDSSDTTDGTVTWSPIATVKPAGTDRTTTPQGASATIAVGDYAFDSVSGKYFVAVKAGTVPATAPTWNTTVGLFTEDGPVVWKCVGSAAAVTTSHAYSLGDIASYSSGTGASAKTVLIKVSKINTLTSSAVGSASDTAIHWTALAVAESDDVQNAGVLKGGDGADILVGNAKANTIYGNAGNDILSGGPSLTMSTYTAATVPMDTLNGGAGNDLFDMGADNGVGGGTPTLASAWDGNQTIVGDTGVDVVDYSRRSGASALTIALNNSTACGDQAPTAVPKEADKIANDVEIVLGGAGNDKITGSPNADFIFGGKGDDTIYGQAGDDYVYGGPGADKLYGEAGSDTFYELNAYPAATAYNEPLAALAGGVWAGLGLATYGGTTAADGPGAGDDVVFGGTDTTEFNKADFTDAANPVKVYLCGDKAAAIGTSGTSLGLVTGACAASANLNFSVDGTSTSSAGTGNTFVNIEYVAGSLFQNNTIIGSSLAETFEGGLGVDTILGQGGADTLFGYPDLASTNIGVDNLSADILCGGDGDEEGIYGGAKSTLQGEGQVTIASPSATSFGATATGCKDVTTGDGINMCFAPAGATMLKCLKGN